MPELIIPTCVSAEETTAEPSVVAFNTEVPLMLYALDEERLALPVTSKANDPGVILIPILLFDVSTTKIFVPSAFCNAIAVVALAPGLITTEAVEVYVTSEPAPVYVGEDTAVPT